MAVHGVWRLFFAVRPLRIENQRERRVETRADMEYQEIEQTQKRIYQLEAKKERLASELTDAKKSLSHHTHQIEVHTRAREALKQIAAKLQVHIQHKIARIVTKCLQSIFSEDMDFRIEFQTKKNATGSKMILTSDGIEVDDILNEQAGGVADICAFGLRLARMMCANPPVRKVLILDEAFKHVRSKERLDKISQMLRTLADELGIQFIIITNAAEQEFDAEEIINL